MAAAACLLSATTFVGQSLAAQANSGTSAVLTARPRPGPSPTPTPTDTPTPDVCLFPPFCPPSPSPSPTVIEVSPVPPDPIPTPTVPSYLKGLPPTPSPTPDVTDGTTDSGSSPLPVVGGFVDQPPTTGDSGGPTTGASTTDLAPRSSALPLQLLAVGALLILGAIGSVIYAVAPRHKPIFDAPRRSQAPRPGSQGGG